MIGKVDSKKADTVAETMIYLLKRVSSVCTITLDNRCEFAAQEKVAEAVNADVFFAKLTPVISGEQMKILTASSNEPTLKKMPLGHLTTEDTRTMDLLINTMPRKVPGGSKPLEVYTGESLALIA